MRQPLLKSGLHLLHNQNSDNVDKDNRCIAQLTNTRLGSKLRLC